MPIQYNANLGIYRLNFTVVVSAKFNHLQKYESASAKLPLLLPLLLRIKLDITQGICIHFQFFEKKEKLLGGCQDWVAYI